MSKVRLLPPFGSAANDGSLVLRRGESLAEFLNEHPQAPGRMGAHFTAK